MITHLYYNKATQCIYYVDDKDDKLKPYFQPFKIWIKQEDISKFNLIISKFYKILKQISNTKKWSPNYNNLLSISKIINNMSPQAFKKKMINITHSSYTTLYGELLAEIELHKDLISANNLFFKLLEKNNISYYGKSLKNGLYDGDISISPDYYKRKIWFFDIEVKSEIGNMDIERANNPIISIQVYDSKLKKYLIWMVVPENHRFFSKNKRIEIETVDDKILYYFNSEGDMLYHFIAVLRKLSPNILVGWYSNHFDIPYLLFRLKNQYPYLFKNLTLIDGILPYIYSHKRYSQYGFDIPGIVILDYMDLYKKYSFENPTSWSLDFIAQINGLEGKTESKGFMEYESNFDNFKKYIVRDVEILYELENKRNFIMMMCNLQEIIHVPLDKMLQNSILLDLYFNQEAYKKGIILNSYTGTSDDTPDSYKGALVLDSEDKTYENVIVLDFASLYPNIITTWNISPETLSEDDNNHNNVLNVGKLLIEEQEPYTTIKFDQTKLGFIPSVIRELLDSRLKYKQLAKSETDSELRNIYDLKQKNYKIIINSIYGVLGFKRFSLYNYKCALAITTCARRTLRFVIEELDGTPIEYKNDIITPRIIYGDTDSVFIHITSNKLTEQDLISISKILSDKINSQLPLLLEKYFEGDDSSVLKNTNKIELDKLFKKVRFFGVKKRYFGYDFNNQLIYHGVELARSDTPQVFQNRDLGGEGIFEDLFRLALDEQLTEEILLDYYEKIKTYPIDVLYIPKTVTTTDFSSYKVLPNHVRGIILWQKISNCKFSYSDKLRYYYVQFKSTEYDQLLREIFNISVSHLNLKHRRQCLVIEKEHIDTFIKFQEKGIFEIDYYTLFEKQILAKLEQFSNLNGIINNVRNVLREDDDSVLKLFNFIG